MLYQPASVVYHEHRGTIGKRFSDAYIQSVLKKNFLLFTWKNIHDWRRLTAHFCFTWANAMLSWLFGDSPERADFAGIARAALQLPRAHGFPHREPGGWPPSPIRKPSAGRWAATSAIRFRRCRPRILTRLRVLFVSPYPICPPVHGGGVFMYQTVRELARLCELHLIVLLDLA